MANGRCRMHGGGAARGAQAGGYKHGRYSRFLPTGLQQHALDALQDKHILSQREGIALLDARVISLLQELNTQSADWDTASVLVDRIYATDDEAEGRRLMSELRGVVQRGRSEQAKWYEVRDILQDKRKMVESERRYELERKGVITADEGQTFVSVLINVVQGVVKDQRAVNEIIEGIGKVIQPVDSVHALRRGE